MRWAGIGDDEVSEGGFFPQEKVKMAVANRGSKFWVIVTPFWVEVMVNSYGQWLYCSIARVGDRGNVTKWPSDRSKWLKKSVRVN